MTKRSLQASSTGIHKAKHAFSLKGWTQENLAGEVNIKTRQPIWRFFTGQPVDRYIFLEICSILDLNYREIAAFAPAEFVERFSDEDVPPNVSDKGADIEALVKQVRSQRFEKIQDQCGIIQMLDVSRPVNLDQVYTDINVSEEILSKQRIAIANFQNIKTQQFDRMTSGAIDQSYISGIRAVEKYAKLRVLGKPGAGKTTFLQHLAVQSNQSRFLGEMVPVFITLRNFVEESKSIQKFSLLDYISQEFTTCGISDRSVLENLLQAGRVLLLFDGMDEVLSQDSIAVANEIRKFSETYHKNRFIASCRTAVPNLSLRGFVDVEIVPFNSTQISSFAQKWFVALTNPELGKTKSLQFIQKLNEPANSQFRSIVTTPLFLHLACWFFKGEQKFLIKHNEFYKEALDIILEKWDEARGIERDGVYRGFLLPQKLKLLTQIAAVTFESGQYFFTQEAIEQHIGEYIQELPNASTEPEEIQSQSNAILRAIESQHGLLTERSRGIFSFSYLGFQEYFTARKIVTNYNLSPSAQSLDKLLGYLTDPQWHEIFLLTASMLINADELMQLMKQKIDSLIADEYIQEFLNWQANCNNSQKSKISSAQYPIGYEWHFNNEQEQILKSFYQANQLLLDCLNSTEVTPSLRQEIELNMLLPFKDNYSDRLSPNYLKPNGEGVDTIRQKPTFSHLPVELATHSHRKYA
jgi:predicted NACHT family NTPase